MFVVTNAVAHQFSSFVEELRSFGEFCTFRLGVVFSVNGVDVTPTTKEIGRSCGVCPFAACVVVQIVGEKTILFIVDEQHVLIKLRIALCREVFSFL